MTVAVRRPLLAGLLALVAVLAGGGLWAARVQIDGAVVASGRLEAAGNRQAVQHEQGGKVAALLVREGQEVARGQVLLRLYDGALRAELEKVEAQLCELQARSQRLLAERDGRSMTRPVADPADSTRARAGSGTQAHDSEPDTAVDSRPGAAHRALARSAAAPVAPPWHEALSPSGTRHPEAVGSALPPSGSAVPSPSEIIGDSAPLPAQTGVPASAEAGFAPSSPFAIALPADEASCAPRVAAELELFQARADSLRQQDARLAREAHALEVRAEGLAQQQAAMEVQAALAEAEIARQEQLLAQHLAGGDRLAQLRMNAAEIAVRRAALALEQSEVGRQAEEAELARAQLQAARVEEAATALHDLAPTAIELGAQRDDLRRRLDTLALRAPVSGRVWGLQVHGAGAVLPAAAPALFVIPREEAPMVVAYVPALARDLLRPGQPARVHLPGIDGRRSPELAAELATISADTFDAGGSAGVYRLELRLQPGEAERLGPAHRLQPGMPVEAFLSTGSRTPLRWLLEPLTAYFRAAMRES